MMRRRRDPLLNVVKAVKAGKPIKPRAVPRISAADYLAGKVKAKKPRGHGEDDLHAAVIKLLLMILPPQPDCLFWHTPNGGARDPREAQRLQEMGVVPGIQDILILWNGRLHGIELKFGKNKQSEEQIAIEAIFDAQGVPTGVAYSLEEVVALVRGFGIPMKEVCLAA